MSIAGEQRVTLPARAYVEREVYEAELDGVFARAWIFVCPERVVAEPGSFATASVGAALHIPTVVHVRCQAIN